MWRGGAAARGVRDGWHGSPHPSLGAGPVPFRVELSLAPDAFPRMGYGMRTTQLISTHLNSTHRVVITAGEDPVYDREHDPAEHGEPHQNVHVPPRAGLFLVHFTQAVGCAGVGGG